MIFFYFFIILSNNKEYVKKYVDSCYSVVTSTSLMIRSLDNLHEVSNLNLIAVIYYTKKV